MIRIQARIPIRLWASIKLRISGRNTQATITKLCQDYLALHREVQDLRLKVDAAKRKLKKPLKP